jgi:2-hydroxychromene-2-carboxylate isomerase
MPCRFKRRCWKCDLILTADEQLARVAERLGLGAVSIERSEDRTRLRELMEARA